MFIDIGRGLVAGLPAIALPPAILDAVERGAWIVFNLSGGKDSSAAMFAVNLILDALGHPRERRIAIHADLGRAEWDETPATVEDLATRAGVPVSPGARAARAGRGLSCRQHQTSPCATAQTLPWPRASARSRASRST